jgi:cytochrome P450
MTQVSTASTLPSSDIDIFSDAVLADPYFAYRALRDAGPFVALPQYEIVVVSRFTEARQVLSDWETFCSAQGVGFNDMINEAWVGTIIASDSEYHDKLRAVLCERLAPRALRDLRPDITLRAEQHVKRLVKRGTFDAVTDLARAVPISIVLDLLGFPMEGRDQLLTWAENSFNALGPVNQRTMEGLPVMGEMFGWLTTTCTRDRMIPGGFATTIHEAADRGEIPEEAVVPLMAGYSVPALDTTISALGSAIELFAQNPDQWDAVRADARLVTSAFNEVIRLESPVQIIARVLTRDFDIDGSVIPAGTRIGVLYGAANRDERRYPNPDAFDVRRSNADHLAFGQGVHSCPGQGLVRLEAQAVITALASQVERFEIVGESTRKLSNITRSLESLPIRLS